MRHYTAVLITSLGDTYHDVKKACCACVEELAATVSPSALAAHNVKILKAVLPNLAHRHSQVRLSCLSATSALARGASANAMVNVIAPGVRMLCVDRTPAVRAAFHSALARWITDAGAGAGAATEPPQEEAPAGEEGDGKATTPVAPPPEGCALAYAPVLLPMLLTGRDVQPAL